MLFGVALPSPGSFSGVSKQNGFFFDRRFRRERNSKSGSSQPARRRLGRRTDLEDHERRRHGYNKHDTTAKGWLFVESLFIVHFYKKIC